jgi:hypothetical protein
MNEYSPFLKLKQNEITALKRLDPPDRKTIIPLLELPRDDKKYTEDVLIRKIDEIVKKLENGLEPDFTFYIDNYEVPDEIKIHRNDNYLYMLESFKGFNMIPIIGFDRVDSHNSIAIRYANTTTKKIALRITFDYFDSFLAYKKDLESLLNALNSDVYCIVLLDCKYIDNNILSNCENSTIKIIKNILDIARFSKIVISGSTIPEPLSIGDKVKIGTTVSIPRNEVILFRKITSEYPETNFVFGDYTVISPGYAELTIDPKYLQNIMTSKIIYSQLDSHYFSRGKALKPYGLAQYFEQAKDIMKKEFFRGKDFSWGDYFLYERTKKKTINITPSSIIGPEVNAHMKFMITEILKGSL